MSPESSITIHGVDFTFDAKFDSPASYRRTQSGGCSASSLLNEHETPRMTGELISECGGMAATCEDLLVDLGPIWNMQVVQTICIG